MGALESLALAATGTALLVAVAWWLGLVRTVPLQGPSQAARAIEAWLPGAVVSQLALSPDRLAGLARLEGGALALVVALGDRTAVRLVDAARLVRHTPALIEVPAAGFGQPARVCVFAPSELDGVLLHGTGQAA